MPASTRSIGGAVAITMLLGTLVFSCGKDVVSIRHGKKAGTQRVAAGFLAAAGRAGPGTARCALVLLLAAGACEAPSASIENVEVSADQLPSEFDSTRTFH